MAPPCARERMMEIFKWDKILSPEEFVQMFKFEIIMDRVAELQTSMSKSLSFLVSHFGHEQATKLVWDNSENYLLTRLLRGHMVTAQDFPVESYATKVKDAKKMFDDYYGEAQQLIMDVYWRFDISLVAEMPTYEPGTSLLEERFLKLEAFCKEAKEIESLPRVDVLNEEATYGPEVITLDQLYNEWCSNSQQV